MNKRAKSILAYSLLAFMILISVVLLARAVMAYSAENSGLKVEYNLIKDDIAGRHYTPVCDETCDLPFTLEYTGTVAPELITVNADKLKIQKDFKTGLNKLKNIKIEYLYKWNEEVTDYGSLCLPFNTTVWDEQNSTFHYPSFSNCTQVVTGTHTEQKQEWRDLKGSLTLKKDEVTYLNIRGTFSFSYKEKPFSVDIIPLLDISGNKFNMTEMAWWNGINCNYRLNLTVTEKNNTALNNYPVQVEVNATSNLNNVAETRVLLEDDSNVTWHRWSTTSFTAGKNYTLWYLTNVSASATSTNYLYYGCTGAADNQKNITSYQVNANTKVYYAFNETAGTVVSDLTGNGVGTITGNAWNFQTDKYNGSEVNEIEDGTVGDDFINVSNTNLDLGTNDYTIEFRTKCYLPNSTSDAYRIGFVYYKGGKDSATPYVRCGIVNGFITHAIHDGTSQYAANSPAGTTPCMDGLEHHIACIRRSGTLEVWKDGKKIATYADGSHVADSTKNALIGTTWETASGNPYTDFAGSIDDFMLTVGYAKTPSEFVPRAVEPTISAGTEESQSQYATESQGDSAILTGIANSIINSSYTNYSDKQVYMRNVINGQQLGRFDVVASSGNQRWAFNYVTAGDPTSGFTYMVNITPVLYVWEATNKTAAQISSEVQAFINSTKI